ncbi:MAG: polysaccharide deacetylase [Mucilaginibacter sp.]|nr:polysaccharide deacetylase [Mucilaginibacter sp.]
MIILGFDVEEFDMPFEYGKTLPFNEQIAISTSGTLLILKLLKETGVKATFFCTAQYALQKPEIILKMVNEGHEIASHGYYHSDFKPEHLELSKIELERISGTIITGYRMARMMPVDEEEIKKAGYLYNSSLNPTWLPGRYNNFKKPRTWFFEKDVLQIPASVSPIIRFPLFWLSFHNLPLPILKWLSAATHRKDGYLNLYFHPWEFTNLNQPEKFGFPSYISKNSGEPFVKRIKDFITWAQSKGFEFGKTGDFAASIIKKNKETALNLAT